VAKCWQDQRIHPRTIGLTFTPLNRSALFAFQDLVGLPAKHVCACVPYEANLAVIVHGPSVKVGALVPSLTYASLLKQPGLGSPKLVDCRGRLSLRYTFAPMLYPVLRQGMISCPRWVCESPMPIRAANFFSFQSVSLGSSDIGGRYAVAILATRSGSGYAAASL